MGNILYEVPTEFQFNYFAVIFEIVLFAAFLVVIKKSNSEKYKTTSYELLTVISILGFCFALLFNIIDLFSSLNMHKKVAGGYESGNYEIVEGYVENFVPMPYDGHGEESFVINGVEFSYSDFSEQSGYNNTKSHGGVIEGNGQHLKIGYVYYNSTYGNIIVYIEQLE